MTILTVSDFAECGVAGVATGISSGNIIGGKTAPNHAWPWMASISNKTDGTVLLSDVNTQTFAYSFIYS
jgi:hypothetical protein